MTYRSLFPDVIILDIKYLKRAALNLDYSLEFVILFGRLRSGLAVGRIGS